MTVNGNDKGINKMRKLIAIENSLHYKIWKNNKQ